MADSTIDSEDFVLDMGRFGPPDPQRRPPMDGFDGASSHNVAAAQYPLGTVLVVRNEAAGLVGQSEFVYGKAVANAGVAIAAKVGMVPDSATDPNIFTNDPDDAIFVEGCPKMVFAISAMTTLYYGWFWSGGVVPEEWISGMGGNFATDGNVAAGPIVCRDLAADAIGLGICSETAPTEENIGFALAADAA